VVDLVVAWGDSEAFAQSVADFFRAKDWPIYGVEVRLDGKFPLVMLWDADVQVTRVIACTVREYQVLDALLYAIEIANQEEDSGNAPCGALGCMAWPGGWREING
jgi:hypothetical protein